MMRFWNSASVAAHAMLKRMSQNDEDTMVFQVSHGDKHDVELSKEQFKKFSNKIAEVLRTIGCDVNEKNFEVVVLGYAPKHSMRGHGRRVPDPHHSSRQHPQPPRRGATAPPRPQLRVTRGGAPPCRCLKDFGMKSNAL